MRALVVLALTCIPLVIGTCDFPPSLWCSSGDIAKACGVYDQCKENLMRSSSAGPVNVTLYFESLCPDCKRFFRTQLYKTWKALGNDVMNLTLVPYGNAHEHQVGSTWMFQCQHGSDECYGNIIETCAIHILKDIQVYFPFINCMEDSNLSPGKAAADCAQQQQIDLSPIVSCVNGDLGNQLEHQMALQTDALNPPHRYVPWVTINGIHTESMEQEAERDLLKLVCETYKGVRPDVCSSYKKVQQRNCYKNL